jgi:hypothetical protein
VIGGVVLAVVLMRGSGDSSAEGKDGGADSTKGKGDDAKD